MSDVPDPNTDQPDDPDLENLTKKMNLELEAISVNQLHSLANQAVEKNLITAHGYHGGRYELLRNGEFILLEPTEAIKYLQELIEDSEG